VFAPKQLITQIIFPITEGALTPVCSGL